VEVDASLLAALEEARRFRLERHAISAAQIERLARDLPLPQLLVPAVPAETIGVAETDLLATALATAIGQLVPEVPTP
jgi:glycine/D-amino acid oxidase-like deaminating enzyme